MCSRSKAVDSKWLNRWRFSRIGAKTEIEVLGENVKHSGEMVGKRGPWGK